MSPGTTLSGSGLAISLGGRNLLTDVSVELRPGEFHVVLGANGAGKSTLLRLLAGDLKPDQGTVLFGGRALDAWGARERACLRSVLSQLDHLQTDFTAAEVVALGRYPCWRQTAEVEQALIDEAMSQAGAAAFAGRRYPTLSGGERRRVQLARALVQIAGPLPPALAGQPRFLLLDEPTAGLDLAHRHNCLLLARELAAQGMGVLAVLHDPDLAMRYADRVTLLAAGRCIGQGTAESVLTVEHLRQAYDIEVELLAWPASPRPMVRVLTPSSPVGARSSASRAPSDT